MAGHSIRLIAFDMDGTVLQANGEITSRLQNLLRKALEQGIHVVPCSGRGRMQVPASVEALPLAYTITSNGGLVWDETGEKALYTDLIPWEMAAQIYRDITELGGLACFHIDRVVYYQMEDQEMLERKYTFSGLAVMQGVLDGEALIRERQEGIEKIFVRIEDLNIREQIQNKILSTYPVSCSSSAMTNLEFSMPGCTKGTALGWLCEYLQIDPSEVAAFGDGENDKEMLAYAGIGVAMGNGHEACKAAADEVIGTCAEDAVADYLEHII